MNDKIRLIFEKIKKVIFENISISVVFFLSIVLIIFFFQDLQLMMIKKYIKLSEEDTKFEESDYLENIQTFRNYFQFARRSKKFRKETGR